MTGKKETIEILDNLIEKTRNMSQEDFDERDKNTNYYEEISSIDLKPEYHKLVNENFRSLV